MPDKRIPLFDLKLSAGSTRRVKEVLSSGWLNTGPKAKEFETELARLVGVKYAAAVCSATAGLQLALEALGAGPGTEIITTPFTFVATAAAIFHTGATPVFADIDPATLNIDPDEVARKVSPQTLCVLPVDIAGHPADYKQLAKVCRAHSLSLVADAAHSLGGGIGRRSVAQLTDAAVHSFQATKNLTTADGGAVLTRHKILADRVRLLSQHAMTSTAYQRKNVSAWEYDVVGLGQKANLTDVHAAIGLGQLADFEKNQTRRTLLAERYRRRLANWCEVIELPVVKDHYRHAWHLFIIRLHLSRLRIGRNRFMALMAEAGIECGVHYRPLFEFSFYMELGYTPQHFPNAAYAGQRVVSLPLYPGLKISQIDLICDRISKILDKYRR